MNTISTALGLLFTVSAVLYAGPLHKAAKKGNAFLVEMLIAQGADVNKRGKYGYTPLHYAVTSGNQAVVSLLCKKGSAIDARDQFDETPIYLAARNDFLQGLSILCAYGADVDTQNQWGITPLYVAALNNKVAAVSFLYARGASINKQNKWGVGALSIAADLARPETFPVLLARGADHLMVDDRGLSPRDFAVRRGCEAQFDHALGLAQRLQRMNQLMVDPGQAAYKPMALVCHVRGVRHRLSGMSAWLMARLCCDSYSPALDMNQLDKLALGFRRAESHLEKTARGLIAYVGKSFTCNRTFLMCAISRNDEAAVAGILDSRLTHVNDADVLGNTALHYAARHGNADTVDRLLAAGAALHAANRTGLSPHHIASMAGHRAIAELLEARGYQEDKLQQPCEPYQPL
jgi:ankyrin repeat protein